LARFEHIDAPRKQIKLIKNSYGAARVGEPNTSNEITLTYDTLILAVGSVSNDFNTPGVLQHCYYLDSQQQAERFQQDLLQLYLDAQHQSQLQDLNIGIIGAGATGVELAAELVQAKKNFHKYGLNKIDPDRVKISLVEGADRILPGLSKSISQQSAKLLAAMQVEMITGKRVAAVDHDRIYFSDQTEIPAQIKIWAAGIKAPDVIRNLTDFPQDRLGRLEVYATLQTKSDPNIFAFGDCAHCLLDASQPPLGPRAQVASQQATFLVDAMTARIKAARQPMFKFSDKGSLVSLSQNKAVGELLGQINVQGIVAKSMYVSLYRLHQAKVNGYIHAGLSSIKDFVTRKISPKIKLH